MSYPTITIAGNIFSNELLSRIEEAPDQHPRSFGLPSSARVKDEIAAAWSEALLQWKIFESKKQRLKDTDAGTTATRQFWVVPLLDALGYKLTLEQRAEVVNGRTYAISHRDQDIGGFPVHVTGFRDSLDKRRESGGPRLSPHALVQEYLNVKEEYLYAVVTNGHQLRLLRDCSRLTKLTYLEFDLVQMMEAEAYADFAVMYRLLHRSRMAQHTEEPADSIVERYHQLALDQGARIREGLSEAVKEGIGQMASALLAHPQNAALRQKLAAADLTALELYNALLRLVYRLLFLLVVEERDLVYPGEQGGRKECEGLSKREVYRAFYSVSRLRPLAERPQFADGRKTDLWLGLFNTFRLFESKDIGGRLGIAPLAGELFGAAALDALRGTRLDNGTFLRALGKLTRFRNEQGEWARVNYAALGVEEFGSVYEGLLEFEPYVQAGPAAERGRGWHFGLRKGDERANTGSHYTPDELVRPLVEHALDPVMERKLAEAGDDKRAAERALLSMKVADVACGSGHFLLAAARRMAYRLAQIRTDEDQPNPTSTRRATRDVIQRCIYGVDKNPMAVELCKVALWLEAHDPGKPLTFLDHRIKCGDALVGLARPEDLREGIPDDAFKRLDGDDKDVAKTLRDRNKKERKQRKGQALQLALGDEVASDLEGIAGRFHKFEQLPDATLEERQAKEAAYAELSGPEWLRMKALADAAVAPFFLRKTVETADQVLTDGQFRRLLHARKPLAGRQDVAAAMGVAAEKRFFHWFLEFPEVFDVGGFDCILGNPPFLGGKKVSTALGKNYLNWLKHTYAPAGAIDLVGYFFRRIFDLLSDSGAQGLIATNTIAQGSTREGGLAVMLEEGGTINFAIRSMKWPGVANLEVAILTIHKGGWHGSFMLDGQQVETVSSYLSNEDPLPDPFKLDANAHGSFIGSFVLGMGFVMEPHEAHALIERDPRNAEVLFPYLNGSDLNGNPDQSPSRWVINFHDWPVERAREYSDCFRIVEEEVKPERTRKKKDGSFKLRYPLYERWWQYADKRPKLYHTIAPLERVLVVALTSKTVAFAFQPADIVYAHATGVFALDRYSDFTILQSTFHFCWAWKNASTLKGDLRYTASSVFETYPFPRLGPDDESVLERIGSQYYTLRQQIMTVLQLGLTKMYNLFHAPETDADALIEAARAPLAEDQAHRLLMGLQRLRELHCNMDEVLCDFYGWGDLHLNHDFHKVDFLPENDRVRYTISPKARKEVLRRLLLLNHERHAEEEAAKKGKKLVKA